MDFRRACIALIGCVFMVGCSTQPTPSGDLPFKKNALIIYSDKGAPIQDALEPLCVKQGAGTSASRTARGISIVGGLGFNYAYEDPRASRAVLYMARKYAEALQEEMKRCGVISEIYMNESETIRAKEHVSQSLAQRQSDGLIQISIVPERTIQGTELFISTDYFSLNWENDGEGYAVTTKERTNRKFSVAADSPMALYARRFAEVLYDKKYIGF